MGIRQPGDTQRGLGLLYIGVPDEPFSVRYLDDTVTKGDYLDVSNLALEEALVGLLSVSRAKRATGLVSPNATSAPLALSTTSRREISKMQ